MSFPKARIQRFNDIQSATPSPADYNVNLKSRVAGAAISKGERFSELRSPASSDASCTSQSSLPIFRTPNPPKKLKKPAKVKPIELFQTSSEVTETSEQLQEKIVECRNKDQYIQELIEQLEDLKIHINDFQAEIKPLKEEKSKLELEVNETNTKWKASVRELTAKHESQVKVFLSEISYFKDKINLLKDEYQKLKVDNEADLKELLTNISKLEGLQQSLIAYYERVIGDSNKAIELNQREMVCLQLHMVTLQNEHVKQMEHVRKTHETEMLKTVTELQLQIDEQKEKFLNSLEENRQSKIQYEHELLQLQNDYEAKIKQMKENYDETNVLMEIQMKEKLEDLEGSWKIKLERAKNESDLVLQEYQTIAESNLIQGELEKEELRKELNEQKARSEELQVDNNQMKARCELLQTQNKDLQQKLNNLIEELSEARRKFSTEVRGHIDAANQARKDRKIYEVTIIKTHTTLDALKRRLMHSDRDVEQLKAELEATEISKLECEEKCNQLMIELDVVSGLFEKIKLDSEVTIEESKREVIATEMQLLEKVECFKTEANRQLSTMSLKLLQTETQLQKTMGYLSEQQDLNGQAQALISKSEKEILRIEIAYVDIQKKYENIKIDLVKETDKNAALKHESTKLKTEIEAIQAKEKSMLHEIDELKQKYQGEELLRLKIEEEGNWKYKELEEKYQAAMEKLTEKDDIINQLDQTVAQQKALIEPFREHLEAYEMEFTSLMLQKQNVEKEAKEMGLRYAQILGHQNHKQKIKHMLDLKIKISELSDCKAGLEKKLLMQSRTIEKLKKELSTNTSRSRSRKDDKENINSPSRTLNTSCFESPNGRLRERN